MGFFTGGLYFLAILIIASYFFKVNFELSIILWSSIVFSIIGAIRGNVIIEALAIMLHFIWGFINGNHHPFSGYGNLQRTEPDDYFKIIMWIGFATGLTIYLAHRHSF